MCPAVVLEKLVAHVVVIVVFVLASASASLAVTVTSAGDGNWNSTTPNAPWPGGFIPTAADDVIIAPGHDITVTTNTVINSITFSGGATRTFTVNAGVTLLVTTGVTLDNAATGTSLATMAGTGTINCSSVLSGGTLTTLTGDGSTTLTSTISNLSISGNLTIDGEHGSGDENDGFFLLGSGAVTVGGTVTLTSEDDGSVGSGDATLDLDSGAGTSGTLNVSGATPFSLSGTGLETTDMNGATATVVYSANAAQTIFATTYTDLTLSGSGTKSLAGGFTVETNVTISLGATLQIGASTLTIDGGSFLSTAL